MQFLSVGPSVQNFHRHVKILDISDVCAQHVFADSSEVCSGIVILGLVLSLVSAQKAGQQTSTPHPCTLDRSCVPLLAPDMLS